MRAWQLIRAVVTAGALGAAPLLPAVAVAQITLPPPGTRVRITSPYYNLQGVTGRVVRSTPDSLTIAGDDVSEEMTVAVARLDRLQVSTGASRVLGSLEGASKGLVVGLVSGVVLGGLLYLACDEECGLVFLLAIPAGAGVGLLIGTAAGVARPPDEWEDVQLFPPSGDMGTFGQRAIKVGLSISF